MPRGAAATRREATLGAVALLRRFYYNVAVNLLPRPRWPIMLCPTAAATRGMSVTIVDVRPTPFAGKPGRPLIGLVLGSGAARGFAHIGVIHALREHGIRPDIVVGTSIGALVGGCYANNQLDELEIWARSLTLRRIIGYLDVKIGGSGLIGGGRLAKQLSQAVGAVSIEELPVRFAAIATEVGTGHEIWLTHGSLSLAMRASYALPGLFPPIRVGGRWLMDGALVNPVPVSTARAFGARVVIAVNLDADRFARGATIASHGSDANDEAPDPPPGTPRKAFLRGIFGAERLLKRQIVVGDARPGFSTVMIEAFNIMQDRLTRMRLAGDPPDIQITPHIGHIGWLEFHRAAEAIAAGRAATEQALEPIVGTIAALG
jgi:NTE family protein